MIKERILNLLSLCMQAIEKGIDLKFEFSDHAVTIWDYSHDKRGEIDGIKHVIYSIGTPTKFDEAESIKESITNGKPKID